MGTNGTGNGAGNGAATPGTVGSKAQPLPCSLVWLASYPGSGALHLYAMLVHYLAEQDAPLAPGLIARMAALESDAAQYAPFFERPLNEMTAYDQVYTRQRVLARIARQGEMNLLATHNANRRIEGLALAPPGITRLAIYVARNPLDVAVSLARQLDRPQGEVAAAMGQADFGLAGTDRLMPRILGDWSGHVAGWSTEKRYPVLSLRYEDIVAKPAEMLAVTIKAINMPFEPDRVERAVEAASLERLAAEEDGGLRGAERFADIGTVGQWRDALDPYPANILREYHGKVMRRLRYL